MAHSILIVDDQREVIRVLESALETLERPFVITGVLSGEEALLEARLNHVDLLVADVRLPGMSGLELYQRIQTDRPQIKTILMTGVPDPETRAQAANAGADGYFTKPVPVADFLAAVEQILGLVRSAPIAPPTVDEKDEPDKRISDRLTLLRQELTADSVTMVNDSGKIMVRAGNLIDSELEGSVLPALMSAFSAGQKVSRILGKPQAENMYFFHGEKYDLIMAPVGVSYALVVAKRPSTSGEHSARSHMDIETAVVDVAAILARMGVPVSRGEPSSVPPFLAEVEDFDETEPADLDGTLETLLEQGAAEELSEEAQSFWEPREDQAGVGAISAGALSYEQARQLGLAPGDE